MRFFIILLLSFACATQPERTFSEQDKSSINQIRENYVSGWLARDSETILGLFSKDATIIPDGMSPINGLKAIEGYWFPNDSSSTTIHSYEVELLDLAGTETMAYSLEKGTLNFTYTKGDFTMTKSSTSHASTIYQKGNDGSWKIISRMWTQLK
ncbi:Ketosteroid isomerase homolog [Ekhidna lutea]|uniref:Ketosteroid isomerase homolog n=1 Tax=Ekhidna lutea TaxID=447679 RepID=A0A239HRU0_EKHLU|nr:nuclear transport factor 2 family protein [Ekhidna lutea]SNS83004.1 Ketosteroid isomerase homolog [Ekhidna lutea]